MKNTSLSPISLPNQVPALQQLVLEQQHMIEILKEQLFLSLRRQFGPKNEFVNIDQLGLFAASSSDDSIVIEPIVSDAEQKDKATTDELTPRLPIERKKAVRILKDLPRDIQIIDLPDNEKSCKCCGGELHHFSDDTSERLEYIPAAIRILETRRKKYACKGCHGEIKRAKENQTQPFAKSMASASLIAFLIVSKYADHLPLYRIAQRLQRLGIELSHALMSDWLVESAELLDDVVKRMAMSVLSTGHVFTDDTILPLQNKDPQRNTTVKARLWAYAAYTENERRKPLVVYDFSISRSQSAPLSFLNSYAGYLQADAYPGYDRLYHGGSIQEIACWAHARRKFVEVTTIMKTPGRAHIALGFIEQLYRVEKEIRIASNQSRKRERQEKSRKILSQFKTWLDVQINAVLPKSAMGIAINYTLKNWDVLCRYTEQGFLEADNNFAERCMRPIALGRKNYLFVGSERGGQAAAIYYSLIESCQLNRVNPFSYVTYLLSNVRNKNITLFMPHEFNKVNITQIG
jgi:transposase